MTTSTRLLVVVLGVALTVEGCTTQSPQARLPGLSRTAITFSIDVADDELPAIKELLRRFEARSKAGLNVELLSRFDDQSGARVNLASIPSPELAEEIAKGKTPLHLFAVDNDSMAALVSKRLVEDLSMVPLSAEVRQANLVPPRFGGLQYFLPFRPNVRLGYVNSARLAANGVKVPRSVEEFRTAARQAAAISGRPRVTLSLASGAPRAVTVSEWILAFGGDPALLNDPGSLQAFQYLQEMWHEGLIATESLMSKYDNEAENLMSETAWVVENWALTSVQLESAGRLEEFEVNSGWRGAKPHLVGGDVIGMPVGVKGKEREAALQLAAFLMEKESQELLVERNAWPSIREDAYGHVPPRYAATVDASRKALQTGWFRPPEAYWPYVAHAMGEAVDRILLFQQPVKPVLDELRRRVEGQARANGVRYPSSA